MRDVTLGHDAASIDSSAKPAENDVSVHLCWKKTYRTLILLMNKRVSIHLKSKDVLLRSVKRTNLKLQEKIQKQFSD